MSITSHIEASGLTRSEICDRAGMSVSMLSMIENGLRKPSVSKAQELARVLRVAPAEIRPDLAAFLRPEGDAA